ncbi:hypothetical protein CHUAL_005219 [Chamberlinius hualienensis]
MYNGREPLHVENSKMNMDGNGSGKSLTFKVKNGCFIERCLAVVLVLFFIGSLVAVGLLVYYLAPRPYSVESTLEKSDSVASDDETIFGAGTTVPPTTKESVLLPKTLRPVYYEVHLQPFLPPHGNSTFAGFVHIQIHVDQSTPDIALHLNNITIFEETVQVVEITGHDGPGKPKKVRRISYLPEKQFVIISLPTALTTHNMVNVSMKFLGSLNDDMAGFYRSSYKDENNNTSWLAVSQFQPTDARRAFPCFDEPDFKAKFNITLIRPSNLTSLSNMPILKSADVETGWTADHYQTTVAMSTYLLAFVVCDFSFLSQNSSNTQFRVWARPQAMGQVDYALNAGPRTLDFFQQYFDIKFPLPKQDMIAIPDFRAGAMENWGLITYRETALLWDPKISSSANKQRVLTVIVHELAHQWFGNLVTPKWWDDLWLNEGFATYMEYVGSDYIEPAWKMSDQFIVNELMWVLELDSLESSHPVSVTVNHPDEINELFDSISYSKGSSVIRMMQHFLGENVFKKGLTNYLNAFSYKNAEQDDLWNHLSKASKDDGINIDVKSVMDSWTKQTGYPVLRVERNYNDSTVSISQSRFYIVPKNHSDNSERWHVPITFTSASNLDFTNTKPKVWLYKNNDSLVLSGNDTVPLPSQWIIFNIRMTSFYRVNYDLQNWMLLYEQLVTNHTAIDVTNRAQLIDDAMDLARGNLLDYEVCLNITSYLSKDMEYLPWRAAVQNFGFLDSMLQYTAAYGYWKSFVSSLVTPIYQSIGFEESSADSHLKRLNRGSIIEWSCKVGYKPCIDKATALYNQWMNIPDHDPIPPNLKRAVVCTAVKQGGEKEWNFAFERYRKSNVGSEKDTLLSAMACTNEAWILGQYLEMSLNSSSGIRKADSHNVFARVAANSVGRFLAFDFLRNRWATIKQMHGSGFFAISFMVKSVTASLNTEFELKELKEFINEHKSELGTATRSFVQAVEETEANVKWMDHSYDKVASWFRKYK